MSRCRVNRWLATLLSVGMSCGAVRCFGEDEAATKKLLDEIVAGYEANMALIQHGTASYTATRTNWRYQFAPDAELGDAPIGPGEEHGPCDSDLTVHFDYPRLRFDWRGNGVSRGDDNDVVEECYIRDPERAIDVNLPHFPGRLSLTGRGVDVAARDWRGSAPNGFNVIIDPATIQHRQLMDPREQQLHGYSVAERIRTLRNDSGGSLKAVVEVNGLVRCELAGGRAARATYWLDPEKRYCIVKSKWWSPRFSKPAEIMVASVREAGNGAFVLESRTIKSSICFKGTMLPNFEERIRLLEIDLSARPDPKLFTIDGLNLPKGAKIQDRIEGRTYRYEPPVSE